MIDQLWIGELVTIPRIIMNWWSPRSKVGSMNEVRQSWMGQLWMRPDNYEWVARMNECVCVNIMHETRQLWMSRTYEWVMSHVFTRGLIHNCHWIVSFIIVIGMVTEWSPFQCWRARVRWPIDMCTMTYSYLPWRDTKHEQKGKPSFFPPETVTSGDALSFAHCICKRDGKSWPISEVNLFDFEHGLYSKQFFRRPV